MCVDTDKEIMYKCYMKLCQETEKKAKEKNNVSVKSDKALFKGVKSKLPSLLMYLGEVDILRTEEIPKKITNAKGIILQYFQIRGRNPECIDDPLIGEQIDSLIQAVVRYETEYIGIIRNQEIDGDNIDLDVVFENDVNFNRLGNEVAWNILKNHIYMNRSVSVGNYKSLYYRTKTGKRYHVEDCPYCQGKNLISVKKVTAEEQKLTACRCVELKEAVELESRNYVTAFVDEAIRPIRWSENGKKGKTGSFSYIICRGSLASENEIKKSSIIAKDVDYTRENIHVERITESAIGKVMITLAYDHNFTGHVQIFTDNISAVEKWNSIPRNSRLTELFESVTVSHIPREKNKKADNLGRTRVFLDLPVNTYEEVENKVLGYESIQDTIIKCRKVELKMLAKQR